VSRLYLRNFIAILGFGLVSALYTMFNLNLDNMYVYIFLKLISFGVIPITLCFSWIWFWRSSQYPFKYLGFWNCITHALFLLMNILRVRTVKLGIFGVLYIALSVFLIAVYLTDWPYTKYGFFFTGGFILLNVVLAFALILTTYDNIHPFFNNGGPGMMALGIFFTELSTMGTLLTASSQLYWHDILTKRREQQIIEAIFAELDAEDD
jgi:hypothetical protein